MRLRQARKIDARFRDRHCYSRVQLRKAWLRVGRADLNPVRHLISHWNLSSAEFFSRALELLNSRSKRSDFMFYISTPSAGRCLRALFESHSAEKRFAEENGLAPPTWQPDTVNLS